MKDNLSDFMSAADAESLDALDSALADFKRLREVKANGTVEIGFLTRTIKPIGLALGKQLAAKVGVISGWLKRLAGDEKAAVRCMACIMLGEVGKTLPESIVKVAHKLASDERPEVGECLANAFDDQVGVSHPEFVYDLMRRWAADSSANVRRVPPNALIRYGIKQPRRVIAIMDTLRHDDSEYVRKNVRFCLQQIAKEKHPVLGTGNADNPDVMLATLQEWAKDTDKHNRWIIAGTLGNVWAKNRIAPALALLKTLADDDDKLVRGAVAASLRDLAKYDAEAIAEAARQWAEEADANVRQTASAVLKKLR
jgi:3-methyladenine DNA glycosylase AlkC